MKTPEDEAFDDLAKKQGDWGGGFKAKQGMAMHKTQDQNICRHYKQWQHCHICDLESQSAELAGIKAILDEYGLQAIDFVADFKAALAQPAQEPVVQPAPGYCKNCKDYTIEEPLYAQPEQEPVACVMGTYGGMFVVGPLNSAVVLPVGMALYATPQHTATWVGLTDEEIAEIRLKSFDSIATNRKVYEAIEAKLKEKNT